MDILQNLVAACQVDETLLRQQAQTRTERWLRWLAPVSVTCPTGEDRDMTMISSAFARRSISFPASIPG